MSGAGSTGIGTEQANPNLDKSTDYESGTGPGQLTAVHLVGPTFIEPIFSGISMRGTFEIDLSSGKLWQ